MSEKKQKPDNIGIKTEKGLIIITCDTLYAAIKKHPYLTLAFYCIVFGVSTCCFPSGMGVLTIPLILLTSAGIDVLLRGYFKLDKKWMIISGFISFLSLSAICAVICFVDVGFQIIRVLIAFSSAIILLLYFRKGKKPDLNYLLILIFVIGISLRVLCVFDFSICEFQHDVGRFSETADHVFTYYNGIDLDMYDKGAGHAAYIEYILHNHKLPDFDMRNVWSFYNPPLTHIISALWLGAVMHLTDYSAACESLQAISLFCSCAVLILSVRFFRQLGLKGGGLVLAFLIVASNNMFIQFSSNINNDPLSFTLALGALVCAIGWYRSRKMSDILKTAVLLGLAMMAKLSASTAAFPIGFLFIAAFVGAVRKKESIGRYFAQFAAFLGVCAPLGLFYQVRNYIRWGIPLSYVQTVDSVLSDQYVGDYSVVRRLFGLEPDTLSLPWVHSIRINHTINAGDEYNPLIMLIKTMLFEEYRQNYLNAPTFDIIAVILIILAFLLGIASVVSMLRMILKSRSNERIYHIFSAVAFFSMMISYYIFCFRYPYSCSQHFRYIPLVGVICGAYIGFMFAGFRIEPYEKLRNLNDLEKTQILQSFGGILTAAVVIVTAFGQLMIF